MHPRISRTKLARFVVDRLIKGDRECLRELAAYLIDTGRVREADLIVREIMEQYEARGIIAATVTSAEPIDEALKSQIATLLDAKQLDLTEKLEPHVLGGIFLETPSRQLDATIAHRLAKLRKSNALNR